MFDQTINQSIKINAVSGTITKSHTKSIILRFNITSRLADSLFSENPKIISGDDKIPAVVLQVMVCGEGQLLAEVIKKSDFEAIYSVSNQKEEKE